MYNGYIGAFVIFLSLSDVVQVKSINLVWVELLSIHWIVKQLRVIYVEQHFVAPPPAEASEIVHQDALAYSEFSQGVG